MAENKSVYSNFVEFRIYSSEEMPNGKVLQVFKDAEGFFYLAPLVRKEGLKTPFSSIEEIGLFVGVENLTLLDKIRNPAKANKS